MARAIILVTDGFGIGSAPDAAAFGDDGANTLGHIAETYLADRGEPLNLPVLSGMGLAAASARATGKAPVLQDHAPAGGAYAAAAEISTGKDTPSGHWEMTGVPVLFDWGYYPDEPNCFPQSFLDALKQKTGVPGFLGNRHASGTDIIRELGEDHCRTGMPICYTSADSVFQVAAHEETFGLEALYAFCETARELLYDDNIGRVIARPFTGDGANTFVRTGNRRDYSISPPSPTVLDLHAEAGNAVYGIGKISDIFAHSGVTTSTKATGLDALMATTLAHVWDCEDRSIIFTNLVNFDQDFGHRRNPLGFADALKGFDSQLGELNDALRDDDLLFVTSDHGCDPTWEGTEHTREFVPILAYQKNMPAIDLGIRDTFADLGQTIASLFGLAPLNYGTSFLPQLNLKGTAV